MNRKLSQGVLIGILLVALAASIHAGGWAIVTVEKMSDHFVAGQPSTLIFTIRQHGLSLMGGTHYQVSATSETGVKAAATALPTGKLGEYKVELMVPAPGKWTVNVDTGDFGAYSLLPVTAIRTGEAPPQPLSQIERGERLFVSKGCIGCHVNNEIAVKSLDIGPDLSGRRFPADYLRKVLTDPAAALLKNPGQTWEMPNLGLQEQEIAALTAYMNRDRKVEVSKTR